jgi:hypothetical protein
VDIQTLRLANNWNLPERPGYRRNASNDLTIF